MPERRHDGATAESPFAIALREPARVAAFDLESWNQVVRQARGCGLLAKLQARLDNSGFGDSVPDAVRTVMHDDAIRARRSQVEMRFEVNRLQRLGADLQLPIILLKGAAYLMANLPPAQGRFAADVDILVHRLIRMAHEPRLLWQVYQSGKRQPLNHPTVSEH